MKKNILKTLACIFVLGLVWSCSTENDVQIDSSAINNSDASLKGRVLLDGVIGMDLGDGVYQITVNESELISEIEKISADEGNPVKFETVEIVKKIAVNNPGFEGFVLLAGTGSLETTGTTTMGFNLTKASNGSFSLANPATGSGRVSCKGCGTGCFLDYYDIDGHLLGYCDSAGCGDNCVRRVD